MSDGKTSVTAMAEESRRLRHIAVAAAAGCATAFTVAITAAAPPEAAPPVLLAQAESDVESEPGDPDPTDVDIHTGGGTASEFLHVPVTELFPGTVPVRPDIFNPVADDPAAAQRGMRYFSQFNCVGCHAPNGGGGMGRALSNAKFIYGGDPENIYLSILQGRPHGMPAWGGMLPDHVIWDLVAYIRSISREPQGPWGATTSADGFEIEQVPAEYLSTTEPWEHTTPFSYGQAPFEKPTGSPPLESPQQ